MKIEYLLSEIIKHGGELTLNEEGNFSYRSSKSENDDIISLIKKYKIIIKEYFNDNNLSKISPLSYMQKAFWLTHQVSPATPDYNLMYAAYLTQDIDVEKIKSSVKIIIENNDIFRATFDSKLGEPIQQIRVKNKIYIDEINCGELTKDRITFLVNELADKPFNLKEGPLLRVALLNVNINNQFRTIFVFVAHHIIADYSTIEVFAFQLMKIYEDLKNDVKEISLYVNQKYTFQDYVLFEQEVLSGKQAEKHRDYWSENLKELPTLSLPHDNKRHTILSEQLYGDQLTTILPIEITNKIRKMAKKEGITSNIVMLTVFYIFLVRYTNQKDIAIGFPVSARTNKVFEKLLGPFVNTILLRQKIEMGHSFKELLLCTKNAVVESLKHSNYPLPLILENLKLNRDLRVTPLFNVMYIWNERSNQNTDGKNTIFDEPLELQNQRGAMTDIILTIDDNKGELFCNWVYNVNLFEKDTIDRFYAYFENTLKVCLEYFDKPLLDLELMPKEESTQLSSLTLTQMKNEEGAKCIHELFEQQVERNSDSVALIVGQEKITYSQLNIQANLLSQKLYAHSMKAECRIAILLDRGFEMIIAILATLKMGGTYIPLDPIYPKERIQYIINDSGASVIITNDTLKSIVDETSSINILLFDKLDFLTEKKFVYQRKNNVLLDNLAYIIYTSGSTGNPKGVMISHRNIANFFKAMKESINEKKGEKIDQIWMATTSIAFDISILELLWNLIEGNKIIIGTDLGTTKKVTTVKNGNYDKDKIKNIDFSLFYFANHSNNDPYENKYEILFEGSRLADKLGFKAVWIPERHFHAFGGIYPSPSVVAASIAMITEHISIRAGSVVVPLHHPVRIAEEWSMVDNISKGRVGISFASGWQPDDFILAPTHYVNRKEKMLEGIDVICKLWGGASVTYLNGNNNETEVKILPRPIQQQLPYWITAAGSLETFQLAGEKGANILTHMLGQNIRELKEKIDAYKMACINNGYKPGIVTLMLHTFIDENIENVKKIVEKPFKDYLRSSIGLMKDLAKNVGLDVVKDQDLLVEHAFHRYFGTSSLFGTPESCLQLINDLKEMGVNEIACLIDFGIDTQTVLRAIPKIKELQTLSQFDRNDPKITPTVFTANMKQSSINEQALMHGVTHFQCTPSYMRLLMDDKENIDFLSKLKNIYIGGEACPQELLKEFQSISSAKIFNMYGPTETTIWSAVKYMDDTAITHPNTIIGFPILNTDFYVLDDNLLRVPIGVTGELYIAGNGLARGYWKNPELTASSFIPNPFAGSKGYLMYKTGDLVRCLANGIIEFAGRVDNQIKIRGYRVELGEIESVINCYPVVDTVAVITINDKLRNLQLICYIQTKKDTDFDQLELRKFLQKKLPSYMIPAQIIVLDKFPLTPNGKIDRKNLQTHYAKYQGISAKKITSPRNNREEILKRIWTELLDNQQISIYDNFFEIGGHSLLAVKLQQKIAESSLGEITLTNLLTYPTINSLAEYLNPDLEKEKREDTQFQERSMKQREAILRQKKITTGVTS